MSEQTPLADDERRRRERSSVPASEAEPGVHDEPELDTPTDQLPQVPSDPTPGGSPAELRLRIERLLQRRESASPEAWAELGEDARALLMELLQDWSIKANTAVHHRLIATLGNLQVKRSVAALGTILQDGEETDLTRAFAANALGRIGERAAVEALERSLQPTGTRRPANEMVRRQTAMALGRIDDDAVVPSLLQLREDPSPAVSDVAQAAVERWEQRLDTRLVERRATSGSTESSTQAETSESKVRPANEVGS